MKLFAFSIFAIFLLTFCEPRDEVVTNDGGAKLDFSEDSVLFDTIFTSIRNVTKRLRVYNSNNNAVNISYLRLKEGDKSPYQLIVNGQEGKSFKNIFLRGKDSIYILVNINLPSPQDDNTPFLVDDKIEFLTNGNLQSIHLRSYGQDAFFYKDEYIPCDITWTNQKPVVIINSIAIAKDCKLTIEAGCKVYLDNSSSIFVEGTLEALGTYENPICFSGVRLEEDFDNLPAQWGNNGSQIGILFLDGSQNNIIEWAIIQNSTTALRLGGVYDQISPDLTIKNTIIKNMAGDGIISFGGDVIAHNNLITNCGNTGISLFLGGTSQLYHNTIANYSFTFDREDPGMILTDFFPDSTGTSNELNPLLLDMQNNIIWGDLEDEWLFNFQAQNNQINISSNFIRVNTQSLIELLQGSGNILKAEEDDLLFKDYREYVFELDTLSPAKNQGNPNVSTLIGPDLNNRNRTDGLPDMGAYERED
jgi:hypothetical protein